MKTKELIVFAICIILVYVGITAAQVVTVVRSLNETQKVITQELQDSPGATESIVK